MNPGKLMSDPKYQAVSAVRYQRLCDQFGKEHVDTARARRDQILSEIAERQAKTK